MALVSISAFQNKIARVTSGGKKSRGRYGSGNIWNRNGIFWVRYREIKRLPDGSTKYVQHCESTGSRDPKVAQRYLNRKLMEVGGRKPTSVDADKTTYDDLRENFLSHCLEKKLRSLKKDRFGNTTLNTLPRLDRAFSSWRAGEITVATLRRFRADCHQEGLSDARANRYMATLRAMFRWGLKDELITRTEYPSYFPMIHEPNEAIGAIYIEKQWHDLLLKELKEPLRSAFTLAYHTAIRVHEMMRLRWEHVDIEKRRIALPREITKTGKGRTIFLPSTFVLMPSKPTDLVFDLGEHRDRWRRACINAGIGHFTCRDCGERCISQKCPEHGERRVRQLRYVGPLLRHTRHSAVKNMVLAGLSIAEIKNRTGHVTDSMVYRYAIARDEDVDRHREVMEAFNKQR